MIFFYIIKVVAYFWAAIVLHWISMLV